MTKPVPQAETTNHVHPLFHAGLWLLTDLLSTLAFVALYAITKDVYIATGLAIALGFAQIAYLKFRGSDIDLMQWLSLFLVVIFGSATLLTHNPHFIMVKPTLIYAAVGAVMLKPGWMNRYMTPPVLARGGDIVFVFGYVWAAMMFATGAANLILALYADAKTWLWFLGVFPLASKFVLVGIQYIVMRIIIRRRMRLSNTQALSPA
ncbi:MAG: septation protein IspZ [Rhodospirillales bacterium]